MNSNSPLSLPNGDAAPTDLIRFPVCRDGWRKFRIPLPPSSLTPPDRSPYNEALLGYEGMRRYLRTIQSLLASAKADFQLASEEITAPEWALLYYTDYIVLESLSAFGFSANQGLRRLLRNLDPNDIPPGDWLGNNADEDTRNLVAGLEFKLRALHEGPSCAAWATLALAKRLVLNREEIRHCAWHSPEWIELVCKAGVAR